MTTLSDAQIAGYAQAAGFPQSELAHAVAIALAESGGRTDAVGHNTNGSTDTGVWQINSIHGIPQDQLLDPMKNAIAAINIYKAAGNWTPWSTWNNGAYLVFMGRGSAAAAHPDTAAAGGAGANTVQGSASFDPNGATASVAGSLKTVTMGGLWLRVGAFILGVVLLIMGAMRLMGTNQTIVEFSKKAAGAAMDAAVAA